MAFMSKGNSPDPLSSDQIPNLAGLYAAHGGVKLEYVSTTQIRLTPVGLGYLMIGGTPRRLTAPVTMSNTEALAANSVRFVYASWTGSAIALSVGGNADKPVRVNGVMVSPVDNAATLVGMVYCQGTVQFYQYWVRSWFHDPGATQLGPSHGVNNGYSSTTAAEISTTVRTDMLMWEGEIANVHVSGLAYHSAAGAHCYMGSGSRHPLDGYMAFTWTGFPMASSPAVNYYVNLTSNMPFRATVHGLIQFSIGYATSAATMVPHSSNRLTVGISAWHGG